MPEVHINIKDLGIWKSIRMQTSANPLLAAYSADSLKTIEEISSQTWGQDSSLIGVQSVQVSFSTKPIHLIVRRELDQDLHEIYIRSRTSDRLHSPFIYHRCTKALFKDLATTRITRLELNDK